MSKGIEIQEKNTEADGEIQSLNPSNFQKEVNGKFKPYPPEQPTASTTFCDQQITLTTLCNEPIATAMVLFKITNHGILMSSTSDLTVSHGMNKNKMLFHACSVRELAEALSSYLKIDQQYCGFVIAKLCIETLKCFKSIEYKIYTSLKTLLSIPSFDSFDIESKSKFQQFLQQLSSTIYAQIIDAENLQAQCTETFSQLVRSHSFKQLMSKHREKNIGLQYVVAYRRIVHNVQTLASTIFSKQMELSSNMEITRIIWLCKVLKDKVAEITEVLYTHFQKKKISFYPDKAHIKTRCYKISSNFVILPPSMVKGFIPSRNTCIDSVSNYVKEIARLRSYSLACRLSDITLKTLKESMPANVFTTNQGLSSDEKTVSKYFNANTRIIMKHLKTLYKQLLQDQRMYLTRLVQEIESNNNEILKGNTKALFRKSQSNNDHSLYYGHVKVLTWETSLGPAQKDFLFSIFMGVLWSGVKQTISACYIDSVFSPRLCEYRLNNPIVIQCEQELLWQMQLKFNRKEYSSKKFVEILNVLSLTMHNFHIKQSVGVGLMKSMACSLKDRFRYVESTTVQPCSKTIQALMESHTLIQEQHKNFRKHKRIVESLSIFSSGQTEDILHQLLTLHSFLISLLISKRQQLLLSACWEQFLVLTRDFFVVYFSCLDFLSYVMDDIREEDVPPKMDVITQTMRCLGAFKVNNTKLLADTISNRSKHVWREHMVKSKLWKRKGSKDFVHVASSYINIAMQTVLSPILDSIHLLAQEQKSAVLRNCLSGFVKTWMEHILDEQIMFSRHGALQLDSDFYHLITWLESDEFRLSSDVLNDIRSLSILSDMKNAIILLACQPDGRKNGERTESNLLSNKFGSSSSVVSQESIESFNGSQFDDVINEIVLRDKERWLALRVKGGRHSNRFLCVA